MTMTLRQKIKIELIKKGIPAAEIGRRMGVTRQAIYQTVDGIIKSHRLRKAIADAIGMEVSDLWPTNGNGHKPPLTPPKRGITGESERN